MSPVLLNSNLHYVQVPHIYTTAICVTDLTSIMGLYEKFVCFYSLPYLNTLHLLLRRCK